MKSRKNFRRLRSTFVDRAEFYSAREALSRKSQVSARNSAITLQQTPCAFGLLRLVRYRFSQSAGNKNAVFWSRVRRPQHLVDDCERSFNRSEANFNTTITAESIKNIHAITEISHHGNIRRCKVCKHKANSIEETFCERKHLLTHTSGLHKLWEDFLWLQTWMQLVLAYQLYSKIHANASLTRKILRPPLHPNPEIPTFIPPSPPRHSWLHTKKPEIQIESHNATPDPSHRLGVQNLAPKTFTADRIVRHWFALNRCRTAHGIAVFRH